MAVSLYPAFPSSSPYAASHTGHGTAAGPAPALSLASSRHIPRGALVVHGAHAATNVFLLQTGVVRLFVLREDGADVTTGLLGPGNFLGHGAILGLASYATFAEALTPVDVWTIPTSRLLDCLSSNVAAFRVVAGLLARRLQHVRALVYAVALLPVAERIPYAQALVRNGVSDDSFHLTHTALAGLIGARPETLARVLHHHQPTPSRTGRQAPPILEQLDALPSPDRSAVSDLLAALHCAPTLPSSTQRLLPAVSTSSPPSTEAHSHRPGPTLAADDATSIQGYFADQDLPAGWPLLSASEPSWSAHAPVLLVRRGEVRLFMQNAQGHEVTLQTVHEGDLLDPATALLPSSPILRAQTLTPCTISSTSREALWEILESFPSIRLNLLHALVTAVCRMETLLVTCVAEGSCARLATALTQHVRLRAEKDREELSPVRLRITHAALARDIGTSRETVTRMLGSLEADGLLQREGRQILIPDPARLARFFDVPAVP